MESCESSAEDAHHCDFRGWREPLGCGTGFDACFLAGQGVHVIACDSSPEMIRVAGRRVRNDTRGKIELRVLAAEDISALTDQAPLDGAFSNFGVLNCVRNLKQFAADLAPLLKPKATVLFCCLGPFCIWEVFWYLAHGELRKAFRRQSRAGATGRLAPGASIRVHYPPVRLLARAAFDSQRLPDSRPLRWRRV